jgi:uncharacterized protein
LFSNYKKIKKRFLGQKYTLFVANTPSKQRLGLSKIKSLPKNQGMIFIYQDEKSRTFTMKNTNIPLMMFFFDRNFNLVMKAKGKPRKTIVNCQKPAMYVIEIPC